MRKSTIDNGYYTELLNLALKSLGLGCERMGTPILGSNTVAYDANDDFAFIELKLCCETIKT